MFLCTKCVGNVTFSSAKAFLAHFNFFHASCIGSTELSCPFISPKCHRSYAKYNSYRKHVQTHLIANQNVIIPENEDGDGEEELDCSDMLCDSLPSGLACNTVDKEPDVKKSLKFDFALTSAVVTYIASLYDKESLNESDIQFIIDSHKQLLGGGFLSILKEHVLSLISRSNASAPISDEEIRDICQMFDSCENMFEGFESHHLRLKEFESSGAYIKPERYNIHHADDMRSAHGHATVMPIELVGQHIPLRLVLKGFLELDNVFFQIRDYMNHLESSVGQPDMKMENLIQGKLWQKTVKPLFEGKIVMPLVLAFDDYETNKELGTHTCVHKMGAGYVRIASIPPQFQAALENIFLAVLFHSEDRHCGNHKVFRKLIEELLFLEETGISVVTGDCVQQVYFACILVIGDNLGANGILGFTECFRAFYYCRVCFEHRDVAKTQTVLDPSKVRTPESYLNDLRLNNVTLTGRKEPCLFNELKAFHVSINKHLDLMHDFDEGVLKYVTYAIVKYFYDKGRFSVDYLNELVQGFYFGVNEEKNRPPYISQDDLVKNKKLRLSASEMRCFVRYFGLMVGHLVVDEDVDVWNQYLMTRRLVDILTAPRISVAEAQNLSVLMVEHHDHFMYVFGVELEPKFHIALHYAEIIEDVGPPDPLSCYRIESKHRQGTKIASDSQNRINLPFTIAKRHQLKLATRFLCNRGLVPKFEYSAVQFVKPSYLKDILRFQSIIPPDHLEEPWSVVKFLELNGVKYVNGSIVVTNMVHAQPQFGLIHTISILNGKNAFLVLKMYKVIEFDTHFYAYNVEETDEWMYVNCKDLLTYVASDIRILPNKKMYIPFRFSLDCFV